MGRGNFQCIVSMRRPGTLRIFLIVRRPLGGYPLNRGERKSFYKTTDRPKPKGLTAYEDECFRTKENKREHEPTPAAGPFTAQVHPGRGSNGGGIHDRAAARARWAGICRSQREDYGGLYRLRHAGNKGDAEN